MQLAYLCLLHCNGHINMPQALTLHCLNAATGQGSLLGQNRTKPESDRLAVHHGEPDPNQIFPIRCGYRLGRSGSGKWNF